MAGRRARGASESVAARREPLRTCIACRRTAPQHRLMRFLRTPDGLVQPDPGRVRGGRGAYLCPGETCLAEALRKNRWGQVFRAPSVLWPETVEGVRRVLAAAQAGEVVGRQRFQMVAGGASGSMARESVEGGF